VNAVLRPAVFRRALYLGGLLSMVAGATTLVRGLRDGHLELALAALSWLCLGFALGLLGDGRAQVQTPRAGLVWVLVIVGAVAALGAAVLLPSTLVPGPVATGP